jgi:hypothetical protein
LDVSDAALMLKKVALLSAASALASMVLPFPGGPYSKMPRTGARSPEKISDRSLQVHTGPTHGSSNSSSSSSSSRRRSSSSAGWQHQHTTAWSISSPPCQQQHQLTAASRCLLAPSA